MPMRTTLPPRPSGDAAAPPSPSTAPPPAVSACRQPGVQHDRAAVSLAPTSPRPGDDGTVHIRVVTANAGHGGMATNGSHLLTEADTVQADVLVVSEPYPLARGWHTATTPNAWSWHDMDACRVDGSVSLQTDGATTSGGVVLLVRRRPCAAPTLTLDTVVPQRTEAAMLGDCVVVTVTYRQAAQRRRRRDVPHRPRTCSVVIVGVYALPTSLMVPRTAPRPALSAEQPSRRAGCSDDVSCADDDCNRQHPIASLAYALHAMHELSSEHVPAVLTGDMNVHAAGPTAPTRRGTAGSTYPADTARCNAFTALLRGHGAVIVNGFDDGALPRGASLDDVEATRVVRDGRHDPPATLDYAIVLARHASRIVSSDVHPWPVDAPVGLDHRLLCTTVSLSLTAGGEYHPSPGADSVALTVVPQRHYARLPSNDDEWTAVKAPLNAWLSHQPYGWMSVPDAPSPVPCAPDVHLLVSDWFAAATSSLQSVGLSRLRATRNKTASPGTLEGDLAAAARHITRLLRRRHNARRRHGRASAPPMLASDIALARLAGRRAKHRLRSWYRADAARRRRAVADALSAHGRRTAPAVAGRLMSVIAGTKSAQARERASQQDPARLNGALTRPQGVREWYIRTQARQQEFAAAADTVSQRIRAQYHDLLLTEAAGDPHRPAADTMSVTATAAATAAAAWPVECSADPINAPFTAAEMGAALSKARAMAGTTGVPIGLYQALSRTAPAGAAAPDMLAAPAAQPTAQPVLHMLAATANALLLGQGFPDQLATVTVRPISKGAADPQSFSNWRMLQPGNGLMWIISHALAARLGGREEARAQARCYAPRGSDDPNAPGLVPDAQSGFRPRRSTLEMLVYSEDAVARAVACGHQYAELMVDSADAFDAVPHSVIMVALRDAGVRGPFWRLVHRLLTSTRLRVQLGGVASADTVPVKAGVNQGNPLGPKLYVIATASLSSAVQLAVGSNAAVWWQPRPAPPQLQPQTQPDGAGDDEARAAAAADDADDDGDDDDNNDDDDDDVAAAGHRGNHDGPYGLSSAHYADDVKIMVKAPTTSGLQAAVSAGSNAINDYFTDRALTVRVKADCTKTALAVYVAPPGRGAGAPANHQVHIRAAIGDTIVPVLTPGQPYVDLGLPRVVQPNARSRSHSRRGTTYYMASEGLQHKARSLRGRVVAAGLERVSPHLAVQLYKGYLQPALLYGLGVWMTKPTLTPPDVTASVKANLHTISGKGAHTAVSHVCQQACFGDMPLWAYAMREQVAVVARVLALHPRHGLRTAMRLVANPQVRLPRGRTQRFYSWWAAVVDALNNNVPADGNHTDDPTPDTDTFDFILQDLLDDADPPHDPVQLHVDPTVAPHIWRDATSSQQPAGGRDGEDAAGIGAAAAAGFGARAGAGVHPHQAATEAIAAPAAHAAPPRRSKQHLLNRVYDIVHRARCVYWRVDGTAPVAPTFKFAAGASSGSSFDEVRAWLAHSIVTLHFPLVDGTRDHAFRLRFHALGGVGAVVDNRNLTLLRDADCCILDSTDPTPGASSSLVHFMAKCPRFAAHRREAHTRCRQLLNNMDNEDPAGRWRDLRDTLDAINNNSTFTDDDVATDWTCLCLGTPLTRPASAPWEMRWYSKDKVHSAAAARRFRSHLMAATAPLVVEVLMTAQDRVWNMPGAHPPAWFVQRRRRLEAEAQRQQSTALLQRQQGMMASYFRPHPDNPRPPSSTS